MALTLFNHFKHNHQTSTLKAIYISNHHLLNLLSLRSITFTILALSTSNSIANYTSQKNNYHLGIIITYLLANITLALFRKKYSDNLQKKFLEDSKEINQMVIIQLAINSFLIFANTINSAIEIQDPLFLRFSLATYVLIYLAYYIVHNYAIKNVELAQLKTQINHLEDQLEKQLNQYTQMSEYITSFRKLRHDYKFLIKGIHAQLNLGDINKAKNFLEEIEGEIEKTNTNYTKYSNHPLLQALLSDFANTCKTKNIQFDATLIMPKHIEFSDMELCRIFSNLITNSIEACQKLPENTKKYITIQTKNNNPWTSILIQNNYNTQAKLNPQNLQTTKNDKQNHGLGLQNVKQIIETHGGLYKTTINQETATFQTILNLPTK